jgi:Domain of unknown function (DUF6089)
MQPMLKRIFVLVASFYGVTTAYAQLNVPKYQLGISAGVLVYQGDLTPEQLGSYKTMKPAVQLFISRLISPSFAIRGNLMIGSLKGDDAKYDRPEFRQQRNFNFKTPVAELAIMPEWNIAGKNYSTRGLSPYLFAGIGYSRLNVNRDYSNLNPEYFSADSPVNTGLPADIQRTPPRGLLVFPVGAGVRYYLSDRLGLSAETAYRLGGSDYLDGFSQSVNPNRKDHYQSHTIGIVYRIGKKNMLDCPVVRY